MGKISKNILIKIHKFANDNDYYIIDLNEESSPYSKIDAAQFIYVISKCDFVFTDSFHASVFSLIFNVNLRIFPRKSVLNMNTRIFNLIEMFHLDKQIFCSCENDLSFQKIKNNGISITENSNIFLKFIKKCLS